MKRSHPSRRRLHNSAFLAMIMARPYRSGADLFGRDSQIEAILAIFFR